MKMSRLWRNVSLVTGTLLISACSVTRDLPEDAYLLNHVKVVADGKYKDISTTQLKDYVRQKTNSRWFSTFRCCSFNRLHSSSA